jgi:hypothetical protein
MAKKIISPFYYKKPVGKTYIEKKGDKVGFRHFEFRKVDHEKHPLLFMFLAGNFENIAKDLNEYLKQKAENKLALFPTYYSKKEVFDLMMQQVGVKGDQLSICYEVPSQPLCELKIKTENDDTK